MSRGDKIGGCLTAVVIALVLFVVAGLGLASLLDPAPVPVAEMEKLLSPLPEGTAVVGRLDGCGSASCYQTVVLDPPPGVSNSDVLEALGLPGIEGERCGTISAWDWGRECVGSRLNARGLLEVYISRSASA